MSLPILHVTSAPATTETLVRYFHQAESNWTAHLAESAALDFGTAWANPQLARVHVGNRMMDVALPAEITPQRALEEADAHFAAAGSSCWQWVMNPSAPAEQTQAMGEHLLSRGYTLEKSNIMYLDRMPSSPILQTSEELRIIPARASFKHARAIHEQNVQRWNEPQLVDAAMMHLDDPHYDALLALNDGQAVAHVGVLAIGEIGLIEQVFVSEPFRRRGIGTTMISRALEICARSLFKHVLLSVDGSNVLAIALYQKFGFRKIGEFKHYQRQARP